MMNKRHSLHDVKLQPAFFEDGQQATLLRYLDPDFINRFQQDIQQQRFNAVQFGRWLEEERHSHHDRHRTDHDPLCLSYCLLRGCLSPTRNAGTGPTENQLGGLCDRKENQRDNRPGSRRRGSRGWQSRQRPIRPGYQPPVQRSTAKTHLIPCIQR